MIDEQTPDDQGPHAVAQDVGAAPRQRVHAAEPVQQSRHMRGIGLSEIVSEAKQVSAARVALLALQEVLVGDLGLR